MSEQPPKKFVQATPFQRFTIRLVDGKFVRVPKADLPSTEPARQTSANNLTEMRELFRLVNGRFTRILDLEVDKGLRVGQPLPTADTPKPTVKSDGLSVPEKKG